MALTLSLATLAPPSTVVHHHFYSTILAAPQPCSMSRSGLIGKSFLLWAPCPAIIFSSHMYLFTLPILFPVPRPASIVPRRTLNSQQCHPHAIHHTHITHLLDRISSRLFLSSRLPSSVHYDPSDLSFTTCLSPTLLPPFLLLHPSHTAVRTGTPMGFSPRFADILVCLAFPSRSLTDCYLVLPHFTVYLVL